MCYRTALCFVLLLLLVQVRDTMVVGKYSGVFLFDWAAAAAKWATANYFQPTESGVSSSLMKYGTEVAYSSRFIIIIECCTRT